MLVGTAMGFSVPVSAYVFAVPLGLIAQRVLVDRCGRFGGGDGLMGA